MNKRTLDQVTDSDFTRFDGKYRKGELDECWPWTACINHGTGYGQFTLGHRHMDAHRFAFWRATRIDPVGLDVCHSCDNKVCVNPKHLWLGTTRENHDDCNRKGRRPKGETHWNAQLTEEKVRAVRLAHQNGVSFHELADQYGIHYGSVVRIVNGQRWSHL